MRKKNLVLCFDGTWKVPGNTESPAEDDSTKLYTASIKVFLIRIIMVGNK
jgi:hypothetical protein